MTTELMYPAQSDLAGRLRAVYQEIEKLRRMVGYTEDPEAGYWLGPSFGRIEDLCLGVQRFANGREATPVAVFAPAQPVSRTQK